MHDLLIDDETCLMGSFGWDNQCYLQYHNGRPLSVALTEPCNCQFSNFVDSDFAIQKPHARSHSSGRRFKRESYSIYQPNVQYTNFVYSPPLPRRQIIRSRSGDLLVEKLETVTIEEEQCRPIHTGVAYVRSPSPLVRQVKIRSRPSSCYDLNNRESTDGRCTKYVDEHREEHFEFNYSFNRPNDRTVPIQRDPTPPPPPPRKIQQSETVTTENFNFKITAQPALRPSTRSVGTTTKDLRPLSRSETQVIERFEKDEKIRRDSMTETSTMVVTAEQPSQRSRYVSQLDTRNDRTFSTFGPTTSKSYNALNHYSNYRQDRDDFVTRYTAGSREAVCDTYDVIAPPTPSYTSTIPITYEASSKSRYHFD
ncbi:unnamed protein product [Adineta ricciae]|uniref:Uncharacterized protein n=1 Tax=Adineta ricciae TaxID=249248 RepID=A0A815HKI3_ADIRI|nr:unnamed protein product [Adineta ricciae]